MSDQASALSAGHTAITSANGVTRKYIGDPPDQHASVAHMRSIIIWKQPVMIQLIRKQGGQLWQSSLQNAMPGMSDWEAGVTADQISQFSIPRQENDVPRRDSQIAQ